MGRAVERGMARGDEETSFCRHHDYVTVFTDPDRGHVMHVADDQRKESLAAWYDGLTAEQLEAIESVSMDMWPASINATPGKVSDAGERIAFDRFHIARTRGDAVDGVRRQERGRLLQEGDTKLTGSKYAWQTGPKRMDRERKRSFWALRDGTLQTARALSIRECAMGLWGYASRTWAGKAWKRWYDWAIRSRLEPLRRVAKMIVKHLWGIVNVIPQGRQRPCREHQRQNPDAEDP